MGSRIFPRAAHCHRLPRGARLLSAVCLGSSRHAIRRIALPPSGRWVLTCPTASRHGRRRRCLVRRLSSLPSVGSRWVAAAVVVLETVASIEEDPARGCRRATAVGEEPPGRRSPPLDLEEGWVLVVDRLGLLQLAAIVALVAVRRSHGFWEDDGAPNFGAPVVHG
ncbi:hypothetical protein ACLOJK_023405 [Asimina triloba]